MPTPTSIVLEEVNGSNGDGRLMLAVFDDVRHVSAVQALGLTISGFEAGASGNFEFGQLLGWNTFAGSELGDIKWAIWASDSTGGTAAGGYNLLATAATDVSGNFTTIS